MNASCAAFCDESSGRILLTRACARNPSERWLVVFVTCQRGKVCIRYRPFHHVKQLAPMLSQRLFYQAQNSRCSMWFKQKIS